MSAIKVVPHCHKWSMGGLMMAAKNSPEPVVAAITGPANKETSYGSHNNSLIVIGSAKTLNNVLF